MVCRNASVVSGNECMKRGSNAVCLYPQNFKISHPAVEATQGPNLGEAGVGTQDEEDMEIQFRIVPSKKIKVAHPYLLPSQIHPCILKRRGFAGEKKRGYRL
jgi:hypothetical protein